MSDANAHLDRLRRIAATPSAAVVTEADGDDGYSAFASGRIGTRPQLTLVLRRVTGTAHAFAYAHLYALDYDPSVGIALHFTQHDVALAGRNLEALFRYLCSHRVQAIQELDPLHAEALPDGTPVVTRVSIAATSERDAR